MSNFNPEDQNKDTEFFARNFKFILSPKLNSNQNFEKSLDKE